MPIRTCVACRQKEEKEKVFRFVLSKDREVTFDLLSRLSGRGCYLHHNCIVEKNGLSSVLSAFGMIGKKDRKVKLDIVASLEKFIIEARQQLVRFDSSRDKSFTVAKLESLEKLLQGNRDKIKGAKIRL